MKGLVNKGWKKFLIIIGVCLLIINMYYKFTTPATIVDNYAENGKDIESDFIDNFIQNTDEAIDQTGDTTTDLSTTISNETGVDQKWIKLAIAILGVFLAIAILDSIMGNKSSKKKK